MSPGMREYLFNPTPKDQPCLGSVSPVSSVNSPGLPSSAGIGVKFGCSESSSAAIAALPLAAPELGLGGAAGAGTDEDGDDDEEDGAAADELAEPAAVFAVASPADDVLDADFAAVVAGASG